MIKIKAKNYAYHLRVLKQKKANILKDYHKDHDAGEYDRKMRLLDEQIKELQAREMIFLPGSTSYSL